MEKIVEERSQLEPTASMSVEHRDMLDLASCGPDEFEAEMIARFGEEMFAEGFDILKNNKSLIYENEGEGQLEKLLGEFTSDGEKLRLFIDMCCTYMLL